jgi:hypothetical protein
MPGQASYGTIPAMDIEPTATAIAVAINAHPSGMTLASWSEARRVSKTSTFRLLKLAGLELGKARMPGINKPVSWLEQHQVDALDHLHRQLEAGMSLAKLEAELASALAPPAPARLARNVSAPSTPSPSAEALLTRLQAVESAIRSGAKLTTAEAKLLIGARPEGETTFQLGRVIARRASKPDGSGTLQNAWTLEAAS